MSRRPTILLTGATGYIASHTWLVLQSAGFRVVGLDNFSNSSPAVLARLERLSGQRPAFERADIGDEAALESILNRERFDAAVHFAALKAVGDSARWPLEYYRSNVAGLVTLARALQRHGCRRLVFSARFRTNSRRAGRATWPPTMPMRRSPVHCWAGRRNATSTPCAQTAGAGNR